MQLLTFLVVLLALGAAETGGSAAGVHPGRPAALVVLGSLLWSAVVLLEGRRLIRGVRDRPAEAPQWRRHYRRWRAAQLAGWLCFVGAAVGWLRWPQAAGAIWGPPGAPLLLAELLTLAPLLAPRVVSWAVALWFQDAVEAAIAALEERPAPARQWPAALWRQVRNEFSLAVAPTLLVFVAGDFLRQLSGGPPTRWQHAILWLGPLTALGIVTALTPVWIRHFWKATPLPPSDLRQRLSACAERWGLRSAELLVWPADGLANAAVAGVIAPWRHIYLSQRLLEALPPPQLEAVLAHEAGHARRSHLLIRVLLLGLPLALLLTAPAGSLRLPDAGTPPSAWQHSLWLPLAAGAAAAAAATTLSWLAEFDADLWAARHLAAPRKLTDALRHLARLQQDRPSWLHPSLAQRRRFLHWAIRRPQAAARLQHLLGYAGWATTCCAMAWLASGLSVERS